jgi:hypothetical protein
VRRILVPAAWKTASNEAVKFDPRSRIRNLMSSNPLAEGEGEVAGLLRCPDPGRVHGDAAQVHPAATMLDEYQHVPALQQHGVHVQEIDREDPGGLGCQELPPARTRAPRCRIDARSTQDLPHGGRRNHHAELHELAVDPAVSPQRILPRQADDKACDARACRRASWPALLALPYFPAASQRCQASSVAGVTGKTSAQRLRGTSRASAANQARSAGSYRTQPACRRSTAFSCLSTSSSA